MSSNLFWRPAQPRPKNRIMSAAFKFALSKQYPDRGGLTGITFGPEDRMFLVGMECAGGKDVARDARALINAIDKYGEIVLDERW